MSLRTQQIIGLAVVVVIVGGVIAGLIWNRTRTPVDTVQPGQTTPTAGNNRLVVDARQPDAQPTVTKDTAPELSTAQQAAVAAENLARLFAERFGSYRSPEDFSGVIDMQPYMTAPLRTWSQQFIRTQAAGQPVSMVTRALSIVASEYTDTTAVIIVSTQRQETRDNQPRKQYKQDLKLELQLSDGSWLVDAAYWQ